MTLILLAILCSTANQLLFKLFAHIRMAALPAIVVNYLVAFGLGCWLGRGGPSFGGLPFLKLQLLAGLQGGVLAGCFLLMSAVTRRNGVAVAAVSTRLAVVIPVVAAFVMYGDRILAAKIVGILLALAALVLLKPEADPAVSPVSSHLPPLLLFFGFGFNLAYTKWVQARFLPADAFHHYLTFCFLWAFAWGAAALLLRRPYGQVQVRVREAIAGVFLGLNNYGAIFFLIAALAQDEWESSVVFPVVSVSVVLLSFFGGALFFGERFTVKKSAAVVLGVLALVLIY